MWPLGTWGVAAALYGFPPLLAMFWMSVPAFLAIEILMVAMVVLLVIVPLTSGPTHNSYDDFSQEYITK